ncbi:hypothetical protein [Sphingobium sp. CFD-2]|uniref:hypothetical protein n=1 Tax=Sphingobium sp. CFD-2 TaxID=2878542 RepID=UPI00214CDAC1|nr:hypothetical protein [Sphingobium sp. CFD-2]
MPGLLDSRLRTAKLEDTQSADRIGLVTVIVPAENLRPCANEGGGVGRQPPQALALTRRLMKGDIALLVERIEEEAGLLREPLQSAEAQEAFAAFLEKRPPAFRRA